MPPSTNDFGVPLSGQNRLYTSAEKKKLVKRLVANADKIAWSTIHKNREVASQIPSRRTLYRLFRDPTSVTVRDETARRIENLLVILENHDVQVAPSMALSRTVNTALRRITGTTAEQSRQFLENYAGCFRCIRLTTASREILVTHLRIFKQAGDYAGFLHVEVVPDEADDLSGQAHRMISHRGSVFVTGRQANFFSAFPAVRQLNCIVSSNEKQPTMTGILLSHDAIHGAPFAARVLIVKADEITEDELVGSDKYGLFKPGNKLFRQYMPYITNRVSQHSVLSAPISI